MYQTDLGSHLYSCENLSVWQANFVFNEHTPVLNTTVENDVAYMYNITDNRYGRQFLHVQNGPAITMSFVGATQ